MMILDSGLLFLGHPVYSISYRDSRVISNTSSFVFWNKLSTL